MTMRSPGILAAAFLLAAPAARATSLVARGKYLATAGDCAACHTAPGGQPFAGGLELDTPFGKIPTPNITPDKSTGIGWMTEQDFYQVMHNGIGYHGEYLYPAMPFPWYTNVTRADDKAIFAYLKTLKPVDAPHQKLHLAFPFNIRAGLVTWRAAFFKPHTFTPNPARSAALNRGAYLVQGLGHCGACHNGNMLYGNSKLAGRLHGGSIDGWYAPDIDGNMKSALGTWSVAQLVDFFKYGRAPGKGVVLGPMAQVVHESLSHLAHADLKDIALYLKSLPAKPATPTPIPVALTGQHPDGAGLYLSHCAFCHGEQGRGITAQIPALAGNGAITAGGPQNVINVVLQGLHAHGTYAPMPAVGAALSDAQIAAIANYVRTAWGNHAPATAGPGMVGEARADATTMLSNPNAHCAAITNPSLAAALSPGSPAQHALTSMNDANFLVKIKAAVAAMRTVAPPAKPADIVNSLTAAYCPRVAAAHLPQAQAADRLGNFAMLAWGQQHQVGGHD